MIDENEVLPFNFFQYGGTYSGGHKGMRYMITRKGEKPDYSLCASVWQGPYASTSVDQEAITEKEFEYSKEGRIEAILWLKEMYDTRIDEWNSAPSIREVKPVIHE